MISDANTSFRAQQIHLLYDQTRIALAATVAAAGILALALWSVSPRPVLLGWLTTFAFVTSGRVALVRFYERASRVSREASSWFLAFLVGAGLSGAIWGLAPILLPPDDSLVYIGFTVLWACGLSAGSVAALSVVKGAFFAFVIPALVPSAIYLLLGETALATVGGAQLLFLAFVSLNAVRMHRTLVEGLRLQLQNSRLVEHLNEEKVRVERLNAELEERVEARTRELVDANHTLEHKVHERTVLLRRQATRLRQLANEVAAEEHRERRRLGSLLHDDLQQLLAAAKIGVDSVRVQQTHADEPRNRLVEVSRLLEQALDVARDLTRQLRPPMLYEKGLMPAFRWLGREMKRLYGLDVSIDTADGDDDVRVSDDLKAFLFEAVRELLFNVVKHAEVNAATVRMRSGRSQIRIDVADGGVGMAADERRDKGAESAWGLYSLEERIVAFGGSLTIESRPNDGTCVTLSVPDGVVSGTPVSAPGRIGDGEPQDLRRGNPAPTGRVLVVDDHPLVRRGLVSLLAKECRLRVVAEAADGKEALTAVEIYRPDLVLMDLQMPHMDGVQATEAIRARWPHVRVIGLSVLTDESARREMVKAGAATFLSKSEDPQKMIAVMLDELGRLKEASRARARATTSTIATETVHGHRRYRR